MELIMRIGVLTGGGDCPGLNAVIRAVVRKGDKFVHIANYNELVFQDIRMKFYYT